MPQKAIIVIMLLAGLVFADRVLAKVELTPERLTPFADKAIVILELTHTALVLIDESNLDEIGSHSYQILAHEPREGDYYLVRPVDPNCEICQYGDILMTDGDDYLLIVYKPLLETLIRQKVMVRRVAFTPLTITGPAVPQSLLLNATVQDIVSRVDPDSVLSHVQRLQDFVSRYSTFDSCFAAADWIADKFADYGCDSIFTQNHTVGHAPNVIGVKQGLLYPDSIYVIACGHFDAISDQAPWIAPGADDNGSGTAMVLEAARVMQEYDFEYSIRFIAFSGEEWGLYGSEYYAPRARAAGDSIIAVFNADMIAYVDAEPESIEVIAKVSNPACGPLADFFIAAADSYTALQTHKVMTTYMPYSDHAPFWDAGYTALLNIEDFPVMNPHYHTTHDTIGAGYNNNAFCTEAIKAHVASAALSAVPYDVPVAEYNDNQLRPVLRIEPTVAQSHVTITLPTSDRAAINVYDASGMLVRTLNRTAVQTDKIRWYGDDNAGQIVPAGVYFVRFATEHETQTVKVVLIR
jgi:hypothetical protein